MGNFDSSKGMTGKDSFLTFNESILGLDEFILFPSSAPELLLILLLRQHSRLAS